MSKSLKNFSKTQKIASLLSLTGSLSMIGISLYKAVLSGKTTKRNQ